MTEPVAEVVERLRQNAWNLADGTDFHNGRQLGPKDTLYWHAADLIERLSRERDTGAPEGLIVAAYIRGVEWARENGGLCDASIMPFAPKAARDYADFVLSAAPQPPTVSTQGWQDTTGEPPRDWVIRKNGYFYRANRSGYTQEIVAAGLYTEAEATAEARIDPRCISAHRASEFTANMPDMVSTLTRERDQAYDDRQKFEQHLWRVIDDGNPPSVPSDLVDAVARIKSYANRVTRERDQAREALADVEAFLDGWLFDTGGLSGKEIQDEADSLLVQVRSVLHPEKEEKA